MTDLIEVLSVWWIKVVLDLCIVYAFIRVAKDKPTNYYQKNNVEIPDKFLP